MTYGAWSNRRSLLLLRLLVSGWTIIIAGQAGPGNGAASGVYLWGPDWGSAFRVERNWTNKVGADHPLDWDLLPFSSPLFRRRRRMLVGALETMDDWESRRLLENRDK